MHARSLTPILNVSNMEQTFEWFEKLGWKKSWDWGDPVTFAGVCSGESDIMLCLNAQGGRGRGTASTTFGSTGDEISDKGVWMMLFVDNVDEVYRECLAQQLEITWSPTDMPWNVREMHVRHPDGHIFRIGTAIDSARSDD